MEISRERVLEYVRNNVDTTQYSVERAEDDLPETVDPERDADILARYGLSPQQVSDAFGGQ